MVLTAPGAKGRVAGISARRRPCLTGAGVAWAGGRRPPRPGILGGAGQETARRRIVRELVRRDWGEAMTDGLVTLPSNYPVPDTIDRLRDAVTAAGLQVFARVDHAAGARAAGLELRPTELLMFGMPLKALAWADKDGKTWLSYNDPGWIAERHGLGELSAAAVQTLRGAIANLAGVASGALER
jgi:uncharacterized protein (DUF302 family)